MKIAIPVKDESLTFFGNAGHTPKFAVYEMIGGGMFRSFKLENVVDNPRDDLDHEHEDEEHHCEHGHNDAAHIAEHNKMGTALNGCKYIVAKRACKNTVNTMKENGITVVKYNGSGLKSEDILKEVSAKFV
jgi:predicted Fe-Mo cluster-binding NifX family protein